MQELSNSLILAFIIRSLGAVMPVTGVALSKKEISWISERRITRITDEKEVQIYPMGAERYLSLVLSGKKKERYDFKSELVDKDVLVIPGHGNSAFLLAEAGARSVTVYDKDPVTIAWVKAFKKFYHYREYDEQGRAFPSVGELVSALTAWRPPLLKLPEGHFFNALFGFIQPNFLRRAYIHYMVLLVQNALREKTETNYELDRSICFYEGTLDTLLMASRDQNYDTAFIPYLLGVKNGIETDAEIAVFIEQLSQRMPKATLIISPTRDMREFYISGKSYFETTGHRSLLDIPMKYQYKIVEDRYWYRTQGLVALKLQNDND